MRVTRNHLDVLVEMESRKMLAVDGYDTDAESLPPLETDVPGFDVPDDIETTPNPGTEDTPEVLADTDAASDFTGAGQTVVILDSGYNTDLVGGQNIVYQYDYVDSDGDAASEGENHGSHVSMATYDEASGVGFIHMRVRDSSLTHSTDQTLGALQWVIDNKDENNIAAVNMSYGGSLEIPDGGLPRYNLAVTDMIDEAYEAGIPVFVAAGNSPGSLNVYTATDGAIGVSATDYDDNLYDWSSTSDNWTDMFGVGHVRYEDANGTVREQYGTSFSSPRAAGVAARLQHGAEWLGGEDLTPDEIVDIMQASANSVNGYSGGGNYSIDGDAAIDYLFDNQSTYI